MSITLVVEIGPKADATNTKAFAHYSLAQQYAWSTYPSVLDYILIDTPVYTRLVEEVKLVPAE